MTILICITFWIITFVKWSFCKCWGICHNFTQVLLWKPVIFVPLLFHLEKNILNSLLTNTITLVKYLRSFELQQIKKQVSKWALDSAIILSLSLFHICDFQGFLSWFVYVNVFSSCRDMLSDEQVVYFRRNSVIFRPLYWFSKISWIQMTSLSRKLSAEKNFTKYFIILPKIWTLIFYHFFPHFSKIDFAMEW